MLQGRDETPDYFAGDTYIQHNTGIADGLSGLEAALAAFCPGFAEALTLYTFTWANVFECEYKSFIPAIQQKPDG